jgi:hypothetical protein
MVSFWQHKFLQKNNFQHIKKLMKSETSVNTAITHTTTSTTGTTTTAATTTATTTTTTTTTTTITTMLQHTGRGTTFPHPYQTNFQINDY